MSSSSDFSKVTSEMLNHNEFSVDENEIITLDMAGGKLEKFTAAVDFHAWYKDFHNLLVNNKLVRFVDMMGEKEEQKKGNFIENIVKFGEHIDPGSNNNRSGDMFETKFYWNKLAPGVFELELEWKARAPMNNIQELGHTAYGWFELKIDIICRRITEKEYQIGNETKKLMVGGWEIRNRYGYRNSIIPNVLNKIPIIKNNGRLKATILNHFYLKLLEKDMDEVEEKILPLIINHIKKYFTN